MLFDYADIAGRCTIICLRVSCMPPTQKFQWGNEYWIAAAQYTAVIDAGTCIHATHYPHTPAAPDASSIELGCIRRWTQSQRKTDEYWYSSMEEEFVVKGLINNDHTMT